MVISILNNGRYHGQPSLRASLVTRYGPSPLAGLLTLGTSWTSRPREWPTAVRKESSRDARVKNILFIGWLEDSQFDEAFDQDAMTEELNFIPVNTRAKDLGRFPVIIQ